MWRRFLVIVVAINASVLSAAFGQTVSSGSIAAEAPAAGVRALFDEYWQWTLREFPELATFVGDHRYDDRLTDQSPAALARRRETRVDFLERLRKVNAGTLSPSDRVSLRVLLYQVDEAVAFDALCAPMTCEFGGFAAPVTQFYGPQFDIPNLVNATRFSTVRDYEAYLVRLEGLAALTDQIIVRMETGMKLGWMPARVAITRVPQQFDAQIASDPTRSPEYKPFAAFPPNIGAADRERLSAKGRQTINDRVIPAFRRLRDFYVERYLPAANSSIASSSLPPGMRYYEARLARTTSTRMSPKDIHALGLDEVARIGKEMDAIVVATGFKGTRVEFQQSINSDPRFFYSNSDELLAGYRDIAKRADAELPRFFAELPRLPYGVRAMLTEEGDNAEHYIQGASDGSRAGYFEANVNTLSHRPKWSMETLLLHEAVPGHHLQIARAQELKKLPEFRQNSFFVAYTEGWALYAESLGDEMGFYRDPYSKFGNLSSEMHRAARLVVDTGIHAFGWTRDQAIRYLMDNAALTPEFATAEVDRYIVIPGQATGYKVGEIRIKALRARARKELGDKFDLRRFHNAVIDDGAVPLDVLEEQISEWIDAERQKAK
jgi:uncharacterized protein (DUF885 family)